MRRKRTYLPAVKVDSSLIGVGWALCKLPSEPPQRDTTGTPLNPRLWLRQRHTKKLLDSVLPAGGHHVFSHKLSSDPKAHDHADVLKGDRRLTTGKVEAVGLWSPAVYQRGESGRVERWYATADKPRNSGKSRATQQGCVVLVVPQNGTAVMGHRSERVQNPKHEHFV